VPPEIGRRSLRPNPRVDAMTPTCREAAADCSVGRGHALILEVDLDAATIIVDALRTRFQGLTSVPSSRSRSFADTAATHPPPTEAYSTCVFRRGCGAAKLAVVKQVQTIFAPFVERNRSLRVELSLWSRSTEISSSLALFVRVFSNVGQAAGRAGQDAPIRGGAQIADRLRGRWSKPFVRRQS